MRRSAAPRCVTSVRESASASDDQRRAAEGAEREEKAEVAAPDQADEMRHEQADEADDAAHRDRRAGDDRRGAEADQLHPLHVHAARLRVLLAEREQAQIVREEREHDHRDHEQRRQQDHVRPRRAEDRAHHPAQRGGEIGLRAKARTRSGSPRRRTRSARVPRSAVASDRCDRGGARGETPPRSRRIAPSERDQRHDAREARRAAAPSRSPRPHAAPPETPRMNGSASALRSSVWNVTPATASVAPIAAASSTRGRRMRSRIVRAVSSFHETRVAPNDTARISTNARSSVRTRTGRIRSRDTAGR